MSETEPQIDEPRGRSYYEVLGVPPSADRDSVRVAYRTRMVELQSDVWRGNEGDRRVEAARVNDAWNTLSDPFQRDRYDAALEDGSAARVPEPPTTSTRPPARAGGPRVGNVIALGSGPVPEGYTALLANRINALFLDVMVCGMSYLAFSWAVFTFIAKPEGDAVLIPRWFPASLAGWMTLTFLLWFVVPTARGGQTMGQRWFGIRVVRVADAAKPGWAGALIRYLPLIVLVGVGVAVYPYLALVPFFLGLSFLVAKTKRGLPDVLARTIVVDTEPRPPRLRRRSRPVTG